VLKESELQQLQRIAGWNATRRVYPTDKCVPHLVAACAAEAPDAVAVVAADRVLTYTELDTRANQVAHDLRAHGVGPDVVVGLCAESSPEMIVGALAILKAGGAYLPLDPDYPADRLGFILNDARCPLVITAGGVADRLHTTAESMVVPLDMAGPRVAAPPVTDLGPDNLAYVIYTSGSTGQPKGVEITHASLLNLVFWHRRAFQVVPEDRATQFAAVGFDAAVWELWPYLTAGAGVYVPPGPIRNDPEAYQEWLLSKEITITFVPTPMAERMMALRWPARASLRVMLTGADTLHSYPSPELPFVLVNNYGPTEYTVVATSGPVLPDERSERLPAIGRPIDNTEIFILDQDMRQVPVGAPGELHIGGAGLARGYVNRPDLTAARFVPHPFRAEPGARVYKTGDLARWLPDGQVAFLGRIDDQLKIRGFRIEPGEIVSVLNEHPDVLESLVLARDVTPGDKSLVAYLVLSPASRATYTSLDGFLRARLPEYMIPAAYVRLDALPQNPNGKIDRKALPEPTPANTMRDDGFLAPRTVVEERVVGILAPLLGLEQVSVEDNFFLLGGNSLLGTQLIARIRDVFGVKLSLRSLFDGPTVAKLSAVIQQLLVEKLDAMTEEEAKRLLGTSPGSSGPDGEASLAAGSE
jgi:amino acid adenylation domain-containing protein